MSKANLSRREFFFQTASAASALGLTNRATQQEDAAVMWNLCNALFRASSRSDNQKGQPRWCKPFDLMSRLNTAGCKSKPLAFSLPGGVGSHVMVSTCQKLALYAPQVIAEALGFSKETDKFRFEDYRDLSRMNRAGITQVATDFYSAYAYKKWVGILWLQPIYVSMKAAFDAATVTTSEAPVAADTPYRPKDQNVLPMTFGFGVPQVQIDLNSLLFWEGRSTVRGDVFVNSLRHRRGKLARTGEYLGHAYRDENLNLLSPDEVTLLEGGGTPSYQPTVRTDPVSGVKYNDFRVLHLARLKPDFSTSSRSEVANAWVDHMNIPLCPHTGQILRINSACRQFRHYLLSYEQFGLSGMLKAAADWDTQRN